MGHRFELFLSFFCILVRCREVDVLQMKKHIFGMSIPKKKVSNFLRCQLIMFGNPLLCNLNNIYKSFLSKLITFYILILDIQHCGYYIYVVSHK